MLCLIAAGLTIVGSFLPVVSAELLRGGTSQASMTVTSWGFDVRDGTPSGAAPLNGIPLVFAAICLLAAAVIGFLAAPRTSTAGGQRAAGLTTVIGAAFLVGTVWAVLMHAVSLVDSVRPTGIAANTESGFDTTSTLGAGQWLLIGAAVLAILAAVLAVPSVWRTDRPPAVAPGQYPAPMPPVQPGIQFPQPMQQAPVQPPPGPPSTGQPQPGRD